MKKPREILTLNLVFAVLIAISAPAAHSEDKVEATKKPELYTVTPSPIKIDIELDGMVVAERMHEVRLVPESWDSFAVIEAAAYGRQVVKGDVLIRFDAEPLEQAIADLEADKKIANLAIEQAAQALPQYERTLQLDLENADRALRIARQDEERFEKIERPIDEEGSQWIMKSAQFAYDSALEELRQLKKMYEADDLTEETEEYILKRQQYQVDQARFRLKTAELSREKELELSIPRQAESKRIAREMAELALAKARSSMELGLAQKRSTLDKMKHTQARADQRLEDLRKDHELLVLRAPADGTVYYGRCMNGKWGEILAATAKLRPGSKVRPYEVLITVVDTQDVYVGVEISQEDLPDLRVGMNSPVSIPAISTKELRGRLTEIFPIPQASGNFAARFSLGNESDRHASPLPGMTCKVRPVTYANQEALLVPSSAVVEDDWTGKPYVMLVKEGAEPKRQNVTLGRSKDDQIEVVEGLSKGDSILLKAKEGTSS